MAKIAAIDAWEILDSRGRPTLAAALRLDDGAAASLSVPSGASTGRAEAKELRDGGGRYRGFGCQRAVANVRGPIAEALLQETFEHQEQFDRRLLELDGTSDKSKLGANALVAMSLVFARAVARQQQTELFQYFASLLPDALPRMPAMTINLFSGGKHAFGQVSIQDVLVVPRSGSAIAQGLALMYDVYQAAAEICARRYNVRPLTADEGGLAPPFRSSFEMVQTAAEAIHAAGYEIGLDAVLAVDLAASNFVRTDHGYDLDGERLSPDRLIETIGMWTEAFPIVSVEDGLSEDAWDHWPVLRQRLGSHVLVLADDLTCTNPARIQRAIESRAANALLLKVNQVGTVTEARDALLAARTAGWHVSVSARSGETEDNWLADLAVGWSADFIKVGSITQSDRLAKYNRLLEIEHLHGLGGRAR
jgi:enolase 1/2/3